jgi:NAD(P)-dependent dehydrogenase (short-subunit alcohol dehydrogenase family)
MKTVVVTGSASGMGLATANRLREVGCTVIGVDVQGSEILADLRQPEERIRVCQEIAVRCDGALDAAVTCAGISGFTGQPASAVVSINYFGTVDLLEGVRPLLAAGAEASVVAVSSNAATTTPRINEEMIEACLDGDESRARDIAEESGAPAAYAASKFAVARWVRRRATSTEWIGSGINLNAIAPGLFDTPMTQAMRELPEAAAMMDKSPPPVGRVGDPLEAANLIEFLLGPLSRFIVGSIFFIDGGKDAFIRPDDWPSPRRRKNDA